jgi:hypothetical protein
MQKHMHMHMHMRMPLNPRLSTSSLYRSVRASTGQIGMNGGHSVSAMLLANPAIEAHTFDLLRYKYSKPIAEVLKIQFGSRLTIHEGKSQETVPPWAAGFRARGLRCDIILVDGDHMFRGAFNDIHSMRSVAAPSARLVVDDIQQMPGTALLSHVEKGQVEVLEQYGPFPSSPSLNPCMRSLPSQSAPAPNQVAIDASLCQPWGYAVARYLVGRASSVKTLKSSEG